MLTPGEEPFCQVHHPVSVSELHLPMPHIEREHVA